jgi:hypothetical protein
LFIQRQLINLLVSFPLFFNREVTLICHGNAGELVISFLPSINCIAKI